MTGSPLTFAITINKYLASLDRRRKKERKRRSLRRRPIWLIHCPDLLESKQLQEMYVDTGKLSRSVLCATYRIGSLHMITIDSSTSKKLEHRSKQ